ncbi:uncharacterized protein LOC126839602 isoform X1 [Adelges cooleyi]|uniref:uncharacterized protein LOC126839602 isoform X1 n=1 Tax=Adelges cooleyi TaxID=133065 RepID=UPI00218019E1|nr:uncharacterized protein LOC126839602 isoform X1 [Adelges cooleyi]
MYLKSILFFCMASFFFQCQGVPPTEEQINMVRELVASKVGHDGKMDFSQLQEVAVEVGLTINENCFRYTNDEAVIFILSFTANTNQSLISFVRDIVKRNLKQDRAVKFDRIKAIFYQIANEADMTDENMDMFESLESQSDRMFHKDDVMTYALAFAATKTPKLKATVKSVIQSYNTSNLKSHRDIIAICRIIADAAPEVTIGVPKYEHFIKYWKNGRFTAETVENIIFRSSVSS